MKELSIEEKAKAYDEVFRTAQELYNNPASSQIGKDWICAIFPELKESEEDEKVRKELLQIAKESEDTFYMPMTPYKRERLIAWLEKQDSCYTFEIKKGHWYKCVCDYMLNGSDLMFKSDKLYYCRRDWRLRGEIDERNVKDIGVNGYKSFFRPATNQEIKDWLGEQGDYSRLVEEMKKRKELLSKEKENATSDNDKLSLGGRIAMLGELLVFSNEKQGEKETLCDKCKKEHPSHSCQDITELGRCTVEHEERPADKVRPKFKVGDWCIDNKDDIIFQITEVLGNIYIYRTNEGKDYFCTHYSLENDCHLWTIQDAKKGDVLRHNGRTFIFICIEKGVVKGFDENLCNSTKACNFGEPNKDNDYSPATKEQRNILFARMHEAGYEWDAEGKELNKAEQNHVDEIKPKFRVGDTMRTLREAADGYTDGMPVVVSIDKEYYHCTNELIAIKDQDDYEFPPINVKQKLADKGELKFKVGNWYQCVKDFFGKGVTFDKDTAYYCAEEGCLQNEYGCHIAIVKDLYDNFKLWTIQDAKKGDVLAAHECLVLFREIDGLNIRCYCTYHFMNNPSFYIDTLQNKDAFHPATKEQREQLEKAMADAGYTFDFEKKELKKIESKPVEWSEEGEDTIGMAIITLDDMYDPDEPNNTYTGYSMPFDKAAEKLKSLRSQKKWKPSEEQMEALALALSLAKNCGEEYAFDLRTLQDQLKKLMEG